ncbi:MAG: TonB-dependent receptor family protein [Rhodothermaceae bacterium]|nr:TonB-dependent receptor family protein [Rhodothermaceae bacterium]
MKTIRLLLLVGLLIQVSTVDSFAQNRPQGQRGNGQPSGTVSGTVVDEATKDAIPSATVALWASRDSSLVTGTITQPDGTFMLSNVRPGKYYIQLSFVGYITETIADIELGREGMKQDLGRVVLKADTQMMDEVEVAAEREFIEVGIDRTVYNTKDQMVTAGGSASDVLENIPSVEVDIDGNISLRGSQNVAILINGRPSPMTGDALIAYLQGLPSEVLERVEVIPNPSAKYDPDGMAGILNLELKKNRDLGLSGTLTSSVSTPTSVSTSGNVSFQKGKVGIFAGYGFRYRQRDSEGWRYSENRLSNPFSLLDQIDDDQREGLSHNVNTSFDYQVGDKSSLTLSSRLSVRGSDDQSLAQYTFRDLDVLTDRFDRNSLEEDSDISTEYRLAYRRIVDPGKHELSIEAEYEHEWEEESSTHNQFLYDVSNMAITTLDEQQFDVQDQNNQEATFQLDYTRPMEVGNDGKIELGWKTDIERLNSGYYLEDLDLATGSFIPDLSRNNTFIYDMHIHAAYGIVGTKIGKVGLQVGVRLEQALTNFDLETTNESFENNYFSAFPSAYAVYEFTKENTLKLSYSKRINRPRTGGRFNQLNPFDSNEDPLFRRVGNPYLKPEYVHAFEISYTRFSEATSLTLTPYYRYTVDEIRFFQTLQDDGITLLTFENFDSSNSWGMEMIGTVKQGRRFNAYLSMNAYRVVTDGSSVDTNLSNKAIGFSSRANATYNVSPSMDVQFSYYYRAPMNIENGRMSERQSADLAVRQKLLNDRANLSIRVRDVFNTMGFHVFREDARFLQEIDRSFQSQSIGLSFTYNFGKSQNRRRNRDNQEGGGGDFNEMDM